VRVAGAGTQLASGERLSVSFDPLGGPPIGENSQFRLLLQNAQGVLGLIWRGAGTSMRSPDAHFAQLRWIFPLTARDFVTFLICA
jgi:hypothetical protein